MNPKPGPPAVPRARGVSPRAWQAGQVVQGRRLPQKWGEGGGPRGVTPRLSGSAGKDDLASETPRGGKPGGSSCPLRSLRGLSRVPGPGTIGLRGPDRERPAAGEGVAHTPPAGERPLRTLSLASACFNSFAEAAVTRHGSPVQCAVRCSVSRIRRDVPLSPQPRETSSAPAVTPAPPPGPRFRSPQSRLSGHSSQAG